MRSSRHDDVDDPSCRRVPAVEDARPALDPLSALATRPAKTVTPAAVRAQAQAKTDLPSARTPSGGPSAAISSTGGFGLRQSASSSATPAPRSPNGPTRNFSRRPSGGSCSKHSSATRIVSSSPRRCRRRRLPPPRIRASPRARCRQRRAWSPSWPDLRGSSGRAGTRTADEFRCHFKKRG